MTGGGFPLSFGESGAKNFIMGMKLAQLVPRCAGSIDAAFSVAPPLSDYPSCLPLEGLASNRPGGAFP